MECHIRGEIAQRAELKLQPGESIWASKGALMAYTDQVRWQLRVPGGMDGAVRRLLSGEGIALTYIEADQPDQQLLLATSTPGHIATWDLADGPVVATRGAFMAAWGNINIDVTIARRAGAALFGGAGLFLQKVSGDGRVLIHGSGDFYERNLAAGEQLIVSSGHLAAFADSIDYNILSVGSVRKLLFGGEGFFMTRLTGPGKVLLQSLKRVVA